MSDIHIIWLIGDPMHNAFTTIIILKQKERKKESKKERKKEEIIQATTPGDAISSEISIFRFFHQSGFQVSNSARQSKNKFQQQLAYLRDFHMKTSSGLISPGIGV